MGSGDNIRKIKRSFKSQEVMEGAGVKLKRAFGFYEAKLFDPFLLLDDFRSDQTEDFIQGFPWHPHRGIETITYVLEGDVEHQDSLGNKGIISNGDVQWMTAGNGIIHQEMPKGDGSGRMYGFQLWANLPASLKMCHPQYQDIKASQIQTVDFISGVEVKVICGKFGGVTGPVKGVAADPLYFDISLDSNTEFILDTKLGYTVIVYIIDGEGNFSSEDEEKHGNETLLLFDDGEKILVKTEQKACRFLLFSGKPLDEPIAWRGPIVMNTQEQLDLAFSEYHEGTFIKH